MPRPPPGYATIGCVCSVGSAPPPSYSVRCVRTDAAVASPLTDAAPAMAGVGGVFGGLGFNAWISDEACHTFVALKGGHKRYGHAWSLLQVGAEDRGGASSPGAAVRIAFTLHLSSNRICLQVRALLALACRLCLPALLVTLLTDSACACFCSPCACACSACALLALCLYSACLRSARYTMGCASIHCSETATSWIRSVVSGWGNICAQCMPANVTIRPDGVLASACTGHQEGYVTRCMHAQASPSTNVPSSEA